MRQLQSRLQTMELVPVQLILQQDHPKVLPGKQLIFYLGIPPFEKGVKVLQPAETDARFATQSTSMIRTLS